MNKAAQNFWNAYIASLAPSLRPRSPIVSASMAGGERVADRLLERYLRGTKHAGSGLVAEYHQQSEPLPSVGDYWIILDSQQQPRCIARTIRIAFHAFRDVPEAVAFSEGDESLEAWRRNHQDFYSPYIENLGIPDLENAQVVTEFYELVYVPKPAENDRQASLP